MAEALGSRQDQYRRDIIEARKRLLEEQKPTTKVAAQAREVIDSDAADSGITATVERKLTEAASKKSGSRSA